MFLVNHTSCFRLKRTPLFPADVFSNGIRFKQLLRKAEYEAGFLQSELQKKYIIGSVPTQNVGTRSQGGI